MSVNDVTKQLANEREGAAESDVVRVDYEKAGSPSVAVVEAVSKALGRPLRPGVLYEAIDPDALDRIFADRRGGQTRGHGYVSFELAGCSVTVTGDEDVRVCPPDHE